MSVTKEFEELTEIIQTLLGPNGCPWDQKQTLESLRDILIEESSEFLDALESRDTTEICEELGDLFGQTCFLIHTAPKFFDFAPEDALCAIKEKLIRRHPHIFADAQVDSMEALEKQWEEIKDQEKKDRKKGIDRIPKSLPVIQKAQMTANVLRKQFLGKELPEAENDEEAFGKALFEKILEMGRDKISPEAALMSYIKRVHTEIKKEPEIVSKHESNP